MDAPATRPDVLSLGETADALLARLAPDAARIAEPVFASASLKQTLLAFHAGGGLPDHPNPGEATLFVVRGSVRLSTPDDAWEASEGSIVPIPPVKHRLEALTDAVVMLTIAPKRA